MKAKILAQYYADAGQFVTKEQSRYSLDAMRIEPHPEKGVVIVATDGHTMGVFHDVGGECPESGITLLFNSSLAEMCRDPKMIEVNDDGSASVLNNGREEVRFSGIESDGKFPNWRKALPKWAADTERNDFNPEYLTRCSKFDTHAYPHVSIWSGSDDEAEPRAAVVRGYERDDCFFLVMPMRRSHDVHYPELIEQLRPKTAAAEVEAEASAATVEV